MSIPGWYSLILLGLAAFRTWRLLAEDDILDRPRRYVTRLGTEWQEEKDKLPDDYRMALMAFITCPWCLGFWLALAWWGAWQIDPFWAEVFAVPMALSVFVPLVNKASSS